MYFFQALLVQMYFAMWFERDAIERVGCIASIKRLNVENKN